MNCPEPHVDEIIERLTDVGLVKSLSLQDADWLSITTAGVFVMSDMITEVL